MDSRLEGIRDWDERAKAAGYSVGHLARGAGISRQHLNRLFQTRSGQSVHHWLQQLRMEKAQDLLNSGISVKEAAAELFYSDPSNFAHAFRRAHGRSPSKSRVFQRPSG